jgi:hypothetical protein
MLEPRELPDRCQSIIDGIEVEEDTYELPDGTIKTTRKVRYKVTPHATAREQAMKHKGLFEADHEQGAQKVQINWADLYGPPRDVPNTIDQRLAEEQAKVELLEHEEDGNGKPRRKRKAP